MTLSMETTCRVSVRVVLAPGDQFRVAGGPYYRLADGTRVPMAARGTFVLVAVDRGRGGPRRPPVPSAACRRAEAFKS